MLRRSIFDGLRGMVMVGLMVTGMLACPTEPQDVCGDGVVAQSEACDDGNSKDGDGCDAHCKMEASWWCQGEPSTCVANQQSLGMGACINGLYDGETDADGYRCHTYRALTGVSMGGGSSSRIATNHPELFDVVGVMGTPFSDQDFFMHMIRTMYLGGFCSRQQLLDNIDDVDDAENPDIFCGGDLMDELAIPDSDCQIFESSFASWWRGPDAGRGGGFTRNGLLEIFHDLNYANGNVFYYNAEDPLVPPGVPAEWRVPLGLVGAERDAARAERCANPISVDNFYNAEYNPDGSYPVVTFCDGAVGDTGDYWPEHHSLVSGAVGAADGRFATESLQPGQSLRVDYDLPGAYQVHCAEHPGSEQALRIDVRGEGCDDGNAEDGDGCSAACLVEPGFRCAAGVCSNSCGDRQIDSSEQCDDGNTTAGDGCSANCIVEAGFACAGQPSVCAQSCGDGNADPGEQCDDGNDSAGDGCSTSCRVEQGYRCQGAVCVLLCGDGVLDPGERCDDGNQSAEDGCSARCQIEPGYSCSGQPSVCGLHCGDGVIQPGETCDDGNTTPDDGCTPLCALDPGFTCSGQPSACATSRCGNGALNPGEYCDDGNLTAGDGCSPWCEGEDGFKCSGNPSVCRPSCGDGGLDPVDGGYCAQGTGTCYVSLAHHQGFGSSVKLRPGQNLQLTVLREHAIPIDFLLAVDLNRNGHRDFGEPVVDNAEERYSDWGVDGCRSVDEDGQGGCTGGAYNASSNPDPNGDDYSYMDNPLGTEGNYMYDEGELYADDGLDGVPATADYGEGDGLFSQTPALAAILAQSPRRRIYAMDDVVFDRLDWWMDAGIRDFINSSQVSNQLWGAIHQRQANSHVFDNEVNFPGYQENNSFWYLQADYDPATIGKNTYLRYGDPSFCPGVDEVMGSGNHVGPGDQLLDRLYTMFSFVSDRLPKGDRTYLQMDIADLGGPTGQFNDFTRLEEFYSENLGRELKYGLVLPPDYYLNPEARYPVVYFMHGQGMNAEGLVISGIVFFTNQKESFLNTGSATAAASSESDWQKMIIIFPDGECGPTDCYTGNFFINFKGLPEGRQFEDAFFELMRHVDNSYRTKHPEMVKVQP